MTDKEILDIGDKFIAKMNYRWIYNQLPRVDNTNKIVCVENPNNQYDLYAAVSAILFWNTPKCLYNFFNQAYKEEFDEELTNYNFGKYLVDCLKGIDKLCSCYRNKDIYNLFHPWVNRTLVHDLHNACVILLSKMFDDEDNYFIKYKETYNAIDVTKLDIDRTLVDLICLNYNGCLTGSIAMASFGTIYRDDIHDVDFIVSTEHLSNEINKLLDDEIEHNKIVGKRRIEVENNVKELFTKTIIYQDIKHKYCEVRIKDCSIDRVTDYDEFVKCTFILIIDGKEYDLIFKSDVHRRFKSNINTFVQDIRDMVYSKTLLGRPKDYADLINFKPFDFITFQDSNTIILL